MKCNKCGARLVLGANWALWAPAKGHNQCKKCHNAAKRAWGRLHPERAKSNAKRSARTLAGQYTASKHAAKVSGVPFTLTKEEYHALRSKPCHYCGGPLPETNIGLDRMVPARGYEVGNVVPCCRWCNVAKNHWFTYEETVSFIGPAVRAVREQRSKRDDPAEGDPPRPADIREHDETAATEPSV